MRLVELPSDPNLVEQLAQQQNPGRSEGVHVSSVIRWVDNHAIHQGKRKAYEDLTDAEKVRMGAFTSLGWMWEEVVRKAMVPVLGIDLHHVGEVEKDGIVGSPDGLSLNGEPWIEEMKCSWKNSRRPLETDFRSWFWQIKSYCYLLEIPRARLRTFFVNGDYAGSGPQIKTFEMHFTSRELEETWLLIKNNARAMDAERKS